MLERFSAGELVAAWALCIFITPSLGPARVYELRTYTTNENKLDDLHARFRDHTMRLFERHAMQSIGYWVPNDEPRSKNTLIYVIRHASREAAQVSWEAFLADPDWQQVRRKSEADGPILAKRPDSVFMTLTDYSPELPPPDSEPAAIYELRVYKTNPGKLANLHARFRDHTTRLFERHGMLNVAYWVPVAEPDAKDTLIYILRHSSPQAAEQSWAGFRSDPQWKKVTEESQRDGQFLREPPQSTFMKATDYSPIP